MEQLNEATKLAAQMLKKLQDPTVEWSTTDDKKLEKLTKLVNVLSKLMPYEETKKTSKASTSKQDKEIIRKFLERQTPPEKVEVKKAPAKKPAAKKPVRGRGK